MKPAQLRLWIQKYGNAGVMAVACYLGIRHLWQKHRVVLMSGIVAISLSAFLLWPRHTKQAVVAPLLYKPAVNATAPNQEVSYQPKVSLIAHARKVVGEQEQYHSHLWLSSQRLFLVTIPPPKEKVEDAILKLLSWKGKAEIRDIVTGKRKPLRGLSRLFQNMGATPTDFELAPGRRWLKWDNFDTYDGWPNPVVARWDGSGYQEFGQDKFSETYWLNNHLWVEEEMRSFSEREYPMRLIIHDVNRPGRKTELRKNSRQAKQLMKRYQKNKPSVAYGFELEPTVRVRLSHYEAGALMPSKEVTVRLPLKASYVNVVISEDNRRALYQVQIPDGEGHELFDIWVSNTDGSDLRELGYVRCKQDNGDAKEFYSLEWLPHNQQISFVYRKALYTLPVKEEEARSSQTLKDQKAVRLGGNEWRCERWRDDIEGEEYLTFFCNDRLVNTFTAEELGGMLIDARYFRCPAPFPVFVRSKSVV